MTEIICTFITAAATIICAYMAAQGKNVPTGRMPVRNGEPKRDGSSLR